MSATSENLVECSNAGFSSNGKWLVRGVDLTIARGQIVTLIGPNGSGKSTTAKLVLGVLDPDEGSVKRNHRVTLAYVPQKIAIDWSLPLTVARFMTLTNPLAPADIRRALERTESSHLMKEQMNVLSGGEMQRVLLARAIARKPDLMVLDEPVGGVDIAGEKVIHDIIGELKDDQNCGVLLISHDLHFVMAKTDQVICLNGHVCCQGPPERVVEEAAYHDLFGGRASETFAFYRHDHDHRHLPDGRVVHADGSITDHCHPNDGHHHAG